MSTPRALYDAQGLRALERAAAEHHGLDALSLMRRAGAAAWQALRERWPAARSLAVVCGPGNNGGDGFVVARLARQAGLQVSVLLVEPAAGHGGAALRFRDELVQAGVQPAACRAEALAAADLVVDALFGTGLSRAPAGPYAAAIDAINAAGAPVLSLDVPSGIDADTGHAPGAAVRAACTLTFIAVKQGLLTGAAVDHVGELRCDRLGLPPELDALVPAGAAELDPAGLQALLPRRRRGAHKGDFGHVLIVGGAPGFGGAARMAGEAAARVGAGLVSLAVHPWHAAAIAAARPELMVHAVADAAALRPLLARASVLVIGPGLGLDPWGCSLLDGALRAPVPAVVDADALNQLALDPVRRGDWVLTPHPGEAARLLGTSSREVQADRFAAARRLHERYGGSCVLKGAGTLVMDGSAPIPSLCSAGNPGMASGGMGDVLSGVIGGLLAQGLTAPAAARLGVLVHARAADIAAADGERGLLASDLLGHLRALVN